MRLSLSMLCKNEIDIIKQTIAYHKPKVDFIIVTDNGSTDGTLEWLRSQVSESFFLIESPQPNMHFRVFYDNMIRIAAKKGADWVLNCDADEFYTGDIKGEINKAIDIGCGVLHVTVFKHFLPTYLDDLSIDNHVVRTQWRLPSDQKTLIYRQRKSIHTTEHFHGISNGNHDVGFTVEKKALETKDIMMCHYGYRGYEHFKRKVLQRGEFLESQGARRARGTYERSIFRRYKEKGEDLIREEWNKLYCLDSQMLDKRKMVKDDLLAKEFYYD